MNLEKMLDIIKDLSYLAGTEILKVYNTDFNVEFKDDKSPLTVADKNANDVIVRTLKKEFPEISILSEESKDDLSRLENKYCFIVDPLDGTKEFIKKNGEFTVNIGLVEDGVPILGVVYVPVIDKMYYAAKNVGSFCMENGLEKRIKVSDITDNLRLVMSRSHASSKLEEMIKKHNIKHFEKSGSSIKGCLVAEGQAECYFRFNPTMEWDTCAMHAIASMAGAIVKQMDDSDLTYNRENSLNEKGFYIINKIENRLY